MARNLGYVLAEVPFFVDVPGIIGAQTAVFVYSRPSPLVEALFAGVVPELTPARGHASAVVRLTPGAGGGPPLRRHPVDGAAATPREPDVTQGVLRWPLPFGEHGTPPPLFARLPDIKLKNWAGNFEYSTDSLFTASSVEQVRILSNDKAN